VGRHSRFKLVCTVLVHRRGVYCRNSREGRVWLVFCYVGDLVLGIRPMCESAEAVCWKQSTVVGSMDVDNDDELKRALDASMVS